MYLYQQNDSRSVTFRSIFDFPLAAYAAEHYVHHIRLANMNVEQTVAQHAKILL